jgi:hypothetical protein
LAKKRLEVYFLSSFGILFLPARERTIMGKYTTVKIPKDEAREAVSLTGAENKTQAIRLLLDEKRRLEMRRRLLSKAGRIAIEYVRPHDRGRR